METLTHLSKYLEDFFLISVVTVLHLDNILKSLPCVQQHFSGPVLSWSVYWHSRGLYSNICKHSVFLYYILYIVWGLNTRKRTCGNCQRHTRAWAPSFTQLDKHVSLIRTTKCYQSVSWLWTRSRDVLISCNLFEMLAKGVKRRGGRRGGRRAGRRVLLVRGNGARCRRGFPSLNMLPDLTESRWPELRLVSVMIQMGVFVSWQSSNQYMQTWTVRHCY